MPKRYPQYLTALAEISEIITLRLQGFKNKNADGFPVFFAVVY